MKVGVGPWGADIAELAAAAASAEAAGFHSAWIPELHRSPFVPLAAMAAETQRITLGTGIALAFVRSPMVTALEAMDLDELCGGRFVLGLGTGVPRLNIDWHNIDPGRPAPHLRETVDLIRRIVAETDAGESIEFEGSHERLRLVGYQRPVFRERAVIPIYLAAMGPVLTRLAGEIADGWVAHELGSPEYLERVILPNLAAGLGRGGKDRDSITVVASGCCVVDDDGTVARRQTAGLVAFYASVRTYTDFFAWHGFEQEARIVQQLFRQGKVDEMVESVPDEMIDALTLSGTPDEVRSKLGRYEGLADVVKVSPPTHFVDEATTRDAQRSIFELLAR